MQTVTQSEQEYMTIAEVRRYLNISQSAAYDLAHSGDFPVCRIGSIIRVPRRLFLNWVEMHTRVPTQLQGNLRKGA